MYLVKGEIEKLNKRYDFEICKRHQDDSSKILVNVCEKDRPVHQEVQTG